MAEYDGGSNLLRRYVHGTDLKADDPLAWYEGAAFDGPSERFMRPDWEGSIALVSDAAGTNVVRIVHLPTDRAPGSGVQVSY